jgi:anthranilate synthase/aminodeoxychorismate synthase-like glutamine amidotransferase
MILIIDNYDSFTYNLVQYVGELGGEISVFRNDSITADEVEKIKPTHIILSPGPKRPEDSGVCIDIIKRFSGKFPILGVCLGHQAIGLIFGGKVINAPKIMHGKLSDIYHDGKSIFKGLKNPFKATRYHSLAVDSKDLPDELEISAKTQDGTIMGLRHKKYPVEGVQFHPESFLTNGGKRLLKNFLEF